MRAWTMTLGAVACLVSLVACVDGYKDSGIIDSGPFGCCTYSCADGETEGAFVSASDGDCQSAASTSCSSAGSEIDSVDFAEDEECAR